MSSLKHQIIVSENDGIDRQASPVEIGIPLPRGKFFNTSSLVLLTDKKIQLPLVASASALWPDNSIKWCFIKAIISIKANQRIKLSLAKVDSASLKAVNKISTVSETDDFIIIESKNSLFTINKKKFNFIDQIASGNTILSNSGHCQLVTKNNSPAQTRLTQYSYATNSSSSTVLSTCLSLDGEFIVDEEMLARFKMDYTFYYETDSVRCDFTIHNPKPAIHSAGLWDLGDPNSLLFKSLNIGIGIENIDKLLWKDITDKNWKNVADNKITIHQFSSGGKNWNSPNHKDRSNQIPLTNNGFIISADGSQLEQGQRVSPLLGIATKNNSCHAYLENFWQNFPKAFQVNNGIQFQLFPEQATYDHELQGGEKKSHTFYISSGGDGSSLAHAFAPLEIFIDPEWIKSCNIFEFSSSSDQASPIQTIIQQGLDGDNNFFIKREVVDEYGWRNFGDLYADHETDNYSGPDIFVSHFNNQYDPIFGFLKQYFQSGDVRWFKLADDLARHVTDIDIYHTYQDRDEYNHGLFWHTDHYLDAETSSHRSYSSHHPKNAYEGHAGGGGPGGQHCYTTGLLFHYLLTGNTASRQAVFELMDWVSKIYDGNGTILDLLISIKNHNRPDLKNVFLEQYPFDRGTGNYINALLDCYYLNHQPSILHRVEYIIRNTVHPNDDIDARNLSNIEETWFYTIFFQSVCRYLKVKEEQAEFDDAFYYGRDSLLHYANWMVNNEYPYLEKPAILEFPNHTWTAQDIRKSYILYHACYYDSQHSEKYIAKADEIYSYVETKLINEPTRNYTRILAILMQNYGFKTLPINRESYPHFDSEKKYDPVTETSTLKKFSNVFKHFLKAIKSISIRKELKWLASRSQKFSWLIGN